MQKTAKELGLMLKDLTPENSIFIAYGKGLEYDCRHDSITTLKRLLKRVRGNTKIRVKFYNKVEAEKRAKEYKIEADTQKQLAKMFNWQDIKTCKKSIYDNGLTKNIYRTYTDKENKIECEIFAGLRNTAIYTAI